MQLNGIAFAIATAGTLCFPQIFNLQENMLGFTNSIFSVLLWFLCLYAISSTLQKIDLKDVRAWKIAGTAAFFFTTAMLFGVRLEKMGNVDFKDGKMWISLPILTTFFAILLRRSWAVLERLEEEKEPLGSGAGAFRLPPVIARHPDAMTFLFLLLCWIPVFLAVYPGFFVYDAQDEYLQVATRTFTTHHPLVHVLLLGGIICAVHKITESYNLGIACYILVQMLFTAGCFTYLLSYLRRKGASAFFRLLAMLYFAFFPVIVMFTLCSAKDTIFTAALLLLLISMLEMGVSGEQFFCSKKGRILFFASAVTMLLFRNNGVYAFLLVLPALFVFHKKNLRKAVLLVIAALLAWLLVNTSLTAVLHAQHKESQEVLTVPIQQLARTYRYHRDAFTKEELATLYEVLPEDALEHYNPKLSDPVKCHFQNDAFTADSHKYASLWLKIGLKKPLTYLNAWLVNSYGFWYPDTVIDVYAGNTVFTFTYRDSSYFGYEVEQPGIRESRIPWLDEAYRGMSLELWQERIPVVSMFFSPGAMFWCFIYVMVWLFYRKRYRLLLPCLMTAAVWLTVIFGPTYLPRYVLIFWFGLPFFAALVWMPDRNGHDGTEQNETKRKAKPNKTVTINGTVVKK